MVSIDVSRRWTRREVFPVPSDGLAFLDNDPDIVLGILELLRWVNRPPKKTL
jgi:hypothetical protein